MSIWLEGSGSFERRRLTQGFLVHLDDVKAEAGESGAQRRAYGQALGHRRVFRRRQAVLE